MAQTINLNMLPKGIPNVVNVSQFDVGREIVFKLYDEASVYTIPAGATVVIAGRKGDNHIFIYEATIAEGRHAVSIETTEQMTAWAGENLCQLRITKTGIDIATVNFRMMVQERPDANGDISDTDIPMIVALATEQELNAEAWAVGTKNGTAVASTDPQYHNNSKYYKEQAATSATNAAASEVAAAASADHADATAADVDEAVQAVEGVVDTTYGMQDSLSIDVDGNPIEGNFAAGVADKLIVDIQPEQDLHGYEYPWVGGANKNKFDSSQFADATSSFKTLTLYLKANTTYTMSGNKAKVSGNSEVFFSTDSSPSESNNSVYNGQSRTLTTGSDGKVYVLYRQYDAALTNYQWQIEEGSQATSWLPYSNECPIIGISESKIRVSRPNRYVDGTVSFKKASAWKTDNTITAETVTGISASGNVINGTPSAPSYFWMHIPCSFEKGKTIYLLLSDTPSLTAFRISDSTGAFIALITSKDMYTPTTDFEGFIDLGYAVGTFTNYKIGYGYTQNFNIDDYNKQAISVTTIDLEDTRYGGHVDFKTGKMIVDRVKETFDWSEGEGGEAVLGSYTRKQFKTTSLAVYPPSASKPQLSSVAPYKASWNEDSLHFYVSNSNPSTAYNVNVYLPTGTTSAIFDVCYELATPIEIQLDPETVNLLKGCNVITANGNTIIHLSAVPEKLINYIVNAFGTDESGRTTASRAYAAKEYFYKDGKMYKVTTAIAQGAAFTVGTNCVQTTIFAELTALNG